MNTKSLLPVLLVFVCFTTVSNGQEAPDIFRWDDNTAQSQIGFELGDPITLTWGFGQEGINIPEGGFGYGNNPNDLHAFMDDIYGDISVWQPIFASVFERWNELCGATYVYEPNDDGAPFINSVGVSGVRADLRICGKPMNGDFGLGAYNYYPNSGDMVLDTIDYGIYSSDILMRNLIAHEHGHGLGMRHVTTPEQVLMLPYITGLYDGPQYHDVWIAHRGYGDAYEKSNANAGNDTLSNATPFGVLDAGDSVSKGLDADDFLIEPFESDFVSIDDQTDTDVYSFVVNAPSFVDISLLPMGLTYQVGPNGGSATTLNTSLRSDLVLELLDAGGNVLATHDDSGLGSDESIVEFKLPSSGVYYVRVTGSDNPDSLMIDTQFYSLTIDLTSAPEILVPESYLIVQGDYASGDIGDVGASDNADLSIRRAQASVTAVIAADFLTSTAIANPTSLAVTIESSVFSRRDVVQTTELYNSGIGGFEEIDSRNASRFTDSAVTLTPTGDVSRFVDSNGNIEVRIRYQSPVNRTKFTANIDFVQWTIE